MSFAEIAFSGAENGGPTRILPLKFIVNTISTKMVSNIFVWISSLNLEEKNKHILNLFNHQLPRSSTTIIILFKMFNNPVFVKSWLLNTNQLIIIPKKTKQKKTIAQEKKNF